MRHDGIAQLLREGDGGHDIRIHGVPILARIFTSKVPLLSLLITGVGSSWVEESRLVSSR